MGIEKTDKIYVSVLRDSLQKKLDILRQLLDLTKQQQQILDTQNNTDIDAFDVVMEQKAELLDEMQKLDQGFDSLYMQVRNVVQQNKYELQAEILEMQNLIRGITGYGIEIEGLEAKNKEKFQNYLREQRKEIGKFNSSNKITNAYHQNMAGQHQEWQTYFLDKKK